MLFMNIAIILERLRGAFDLEYVPKLLSFSKASKPWGGDIAFSPLFLVRFVIGLLVSAVAVRLALKIFPFKQKRESFGGALLTALVGAVIFWIFTAIKIPFGTLIALILWLYALKKIQGVGWLGAIALAILIYIINAIFGLFLPTIL